MGCYVVSVVKARGFWCIIREACAPRSVTSLLMALRRSARRSGLVMWSSIPACKQRSLSPITTRIVSKEDVDKGVMNTH